MVRRSPRPLSLEFLEDRLTPASPGLLSGLVSPAAALVGQPLAVGNLADAGSQPVGPSATSGGLGLNLGLPLLGSVQVNLSLPLGGVVGGLVGGLTTGLGLNGSDSAGQPVVSTPTPALPGVPANPLPGNAPAPPSGLPAQTPPQQTGLGLNGGDPAGQPVVSAPTPALPDPPGVPATPLPGNTPALPSGLSEQPPVQQTGPSPATPPNEPPAIPLPVRALVSAQVLPFAPGESAQAPVDPPVSRPPDPTGPEATTEVTGAIPGDPPSLPAASLFTPAEGIPMLAALSGAVLPAVPASGGNGGNSTEQTEADLAGLALEGADLATGFQPGSAAEAGTILTYLDLLEQAPSASGLPIWLLGVAAVSALGTTWLSCRNPEREALGLASDDLLGECLLP